MDTGEVAMIVTLKRSNGVWVVGCLDGTAHAFAEFLDAAMFAAAEYERLAFEVVGWGAEVATC
jgi:hypothetical protein